MYQLQLWAPADLDHVRAFLRRHRIRVHGDGGAAAQVSVPGSATPAHERRELAGCVATWNALNPGRPIGVTVPAVNSYG